MEIVDARKRHKEAGEHQEWNSMNRAVRKRLREDKVSFLEDMCAKLEQHADNPKKLHSLIKDITRKPAPRLLVIKDPAGNVLTEDAAIKERWASYCESFYERQQDRQPVDIDTPPEQIAEQSPLREEVEQAVRLLKSGKSPGCDNVAAELWKASGEKGVDILWKLCVAIWMTGSWPEDFKCSLYITLPKKGDLQNCANYRTIALICHASKIMLTIIAKRIERYLDDNYFRESSRIQKRQRNAEPHLQSAFDHGEMQGAQHSTLHVLH